MRKECGQSELGVEMGIRQRELSFVRNVMRREIRVKASGVSGLISRSKQKALLNPCRTSFYIQSWIPKNLEQHRYTYPVLM